MKVQSLHIQNTMRIKVAELDRLNSKMMEAEL